MIEQEIVEKPDLAQLATLQKSKIKEANPVIKKKKPSILPWVGIAGIAALWYYDNRKKQKAFTLARQTELARTQQQSKVNTPNEPSGNGNSPESRLSAMGINTGKPGQYQAGEIFKEV